MDHKQVMNIVRTALAEHQTPIRLLAIRVGVSPGALYAIVNGRTRWPRDTTLFSLLDILGLELTVTRKVRYAAAPIASTEKRVH